MSTSIKKAVAKWAVTAAVVVAGVLGAVGMAAAAWRDDANHDNVVLSSVDMGIAFLIDEHLYDTARIEIVKGAEVLDGEELYNAGLGDIDNVVGNLGVLKVTTNIDGWNVYMKTKYGGLLRFAGDSTKTGDKICPPGTSESFWDATKCQVGGNTGPYLDKIDEYEPGDLRSLVYADKSLSLASKTGDDGVLNNSGASNNDTVQLVVKIGVCT